MRKQKRPAGRPGAGRSSDGIVERQQTTPEAECRQRLPLSKMAAELGRALADLPEEDRAGLTAWVVSLGLPARGIAGLPTGARAHG